MVAGERSARRLSRLAQHQRRRAAGPTRWVTGTAIEIPVQPRRPDLDRGRRGRLQRARCESSSGRDSAPSDRVTVARRARVRRLGLVAAALRDLSRTVMHPLARQCIGRARASVAALPSPWRPLGTAKLQLRPRRRSSGTTRRPGEFSIYDRHFLAPIPGGSSAPARPRCGRRRGRLRQRRDRGVRGRRTPTTGVAMAFGALTGASNTSGRSRARPRRGSPRSRDFDRDGKDRPALAQPDRAHARSLEAVRGSHARVPLSTSISWTGRVRRAWRSMPSWPRAGDYDGDGRPRPALALRRRTARDHLPHRSASPLRLSRAGVGEPATATCARGRLGPDRRRRPARRSCSRTTRSPG